MEVCRNKQSQKYFIYLGELHNQKDGLFINHQPRILRLPMNHFEEIVDEEEATLLSKGFLTDEQIHLYRQKRINDDLEPERDDTSEPQSRKYRRSMFREHISNKKYRQDDLIPLLVLLVGNNGGKATKSYVEATIYELF